MNSQTLRRYFALAALGLPLLTGSLNGHTATPSSGTLSAAGDQLQWAGGPFTAVSPDPRACVDGISCDTFELTIDIPDDQQAIVRFRIDWLDSQNDFDLIIFNSEGGRVASSGQGMTEFEEVTVDELPAGTYNIVINAYATVNASYDGEVELVALTPVPEGLRLFMHGNLHDGCTGNGAIDVESPAGGCTPFFSSDPRDTAEPARWGPLNPLSQCSPPGSRCAITPNWIWNLDEPTTLDGSVYVGWWASIGPSSDIALWDEYYVRVYADGKEIGTSGVAYWSNIPVTGVSLYRELDVSVDRTTAYDNILVVIDPFRPAQAGTFFYYDSQSNCPGSIPINSVCDSHAIFPVVDTLPSPPVARDDNAFVLNGSSATVNLLANDSNFNEGPLAVEIVTPPSGGSAMLTPENSLHYTHGGTAPTTDALTYQITDSLGLSDIATVSIKISAECLAAGGAFQDDFESDAPGWTVETEVLFPPSLSWQLTTDPFAPSGTTLWHTDANAQVPSGSTAKDVRLASPPHRVSAATQLSFWHRFNTEDGFDGGVLEVSTDAGASWMDIAAAGGQFLSGEYNSVLAPGSGFVLTGREGWSGQSADFLNGTMHRVAVDLGGLAGETVMVRFRFGQDALIAEPAGGWWIDDVGFDELLEPCPDTDADGVGDLLDNCVEIHNPDQCNTNGNGFGPGQDNFGNQCDADLDNNGIVNSFDLQLMRGAFGATGPNDADLDCNGTVNSFDLQLMRQSFGGMPGPTGIR